ncbi:MAG: hypothetical protein IT386_01025 [Deltaproteobacteria bacterium]|nr:hypothetical protein [Deltaproteobacteria bacterium]
MLRKLLLRWGAALLWAAASLPAPANAELASAFVSPEGRFAAVFPAEPMHERSGRDTWAGRVEEGSFDLTRDGLRLRVEYHDVPRMAVAILPPSLVLDLAKQGVLDDMGASGASAEPISLHGHPGLALRYVPAAYPGVTEETRLFLVGSRLYVAFARAEQPGTAEQAVARFLASFDAWESGGTVASVAGGSSGGM